MNEKKIAVTLYMAELLYDIENKTHLSGKGADDGENYKRVSDSQASDEENSRSEVLRSIEEAYSMLKDELSHYISEDSLVVTNGVIAVTDALISEKDSLKLTLNMPENFNLASAQTVCSLMHKYVVNYAIWRWFHVMHIEGANDYLALAEDNLTDMRSALNRKINTARRKLTPY